MTNLDVIQHISSNDPSRLAQLLNDIYWSARLRNTMYAMGNRPTTEFDNFEKWLNSNAEETSVWYKHELKKWAKITTALM